MMLERKRQRALLRLRLRDVAARDDVNSFVVFCLLFSRFFLQETAGKEEEETL